MNNYYSLIYLTEHLNTKLEGATYHSGISPHRNVWEGTFEKTDGELSRLAFSTAPGEIALFTDQWRSPKKSNTYAFFETLAGKKIRGVRLAQDDRFITICFEHGQVLLFQLFGNRANLFHAEDGIVTGSFKNRNELTGSDIPVARKPKEVIEPDESLTPRQLVLHFDQKMPRHLIDPVIDHFQLNGAGTERVKEVVRKLTAAMKNRPVYRVLQNGNLCLVPPDLLPLENRKIFTRINDAVKYCYYNASRLRRFENKVQSLRPNLVKSLEKAAGTLRQLNQAGKTLERAQEYEKFGHLLMSRAHEKRDPAKDTLEVGDFYNQNEIISIPLRQHLSIAENAGYFYDKSAKAKRNAEESERRKETTRQKVRKLEHLLKALDEITDLQGLENWQRERKQDLQDLGITAGSSQKTSLPWRRTEIDGYEIRIGKNAASNDKLTSTAHKEDVWLHARGAGGSHVVIRMDNQSADPPKKIIRLAASYAAWHSKLRGAGLVPVIVTKRKYVTKPKGAPPGTVRVQREEVEMVAPVKP